jgi:ABC-2 type transport system permease protein
MIAIFKRELKSYFYTPTAYVFLGAMFVFFGLFFVMNNILARFSQYGDPQPASANFAMTIDPMILVLLFLIPILVMRLISEERKQKTDQLLHTVPISTFEIVVAKFLSALVVFSTGVIISLIYPLLLFFFA